jgi:hypothetical protein
MGRPFRCTGGTESALPPREQGSGAITPFHFPETKSMRIPSLLALAGAVLVTAACPRDREPEVAPDTVAVAPHNDPGAMPEAAQTVDLQPVGGENISAQAVVLPVGVQTQVTVHVRQAPPNTPLTAHVMTGSCDQLGPTAADLQPVVTDAGGLGTSQIVIDMPTEIVINGNHVVQLRRGNGRDGIPVACGQIPAHPVIHGSG